MHLAELWRYPVKSMAGELLESAELGAEGVPGDRIVQAHIREKEGPRIVTARSRPLLLRHRATLGADGEPLVDGRPWRDPLVAADVERAAGAGARLARSDELAARFDILPLLVMTDGAIAAIAEAPELAAVRVDRRRFRPNLLIGGVEGFAEMEWEGRSVRIGGVGGAVVELVDLRGRCAMPTFDPDDGRQAVGVLRAVARATGGVLGLNSRVVKPGLVRVGDPVELL